MNEDTPTGPGVEPGHLADGTPIPDPPAEHPLMRCIDSVGQLATSVQQLTHYTREYQRTYYEHFHPISSTVHAEEVAAADGIRQRMPDMLHSLTEVVGAVGMLAERLSYFQGDPTFGWHQAADRLGRRCDRLHADFRKALPEAEATNAAHAAAWNVWAQRVDQVMPRTDTD